MTQHGPARRKRQRQRGVAIILTMIVMASLLFGSIIATGLRMFGIRISGQGLASARTYYCAEAGLAAGRDYFRQHYADWNTYLSTGFSVAGQAAIDGVSLTYTVTIQDNVDELPPLSNDPRTDLDKTVILVSTCTDPDLQDARELHQYLTMIPISVFKTIPAL